MEDEFPGLLEAVIVDLEPVFTRWIAAELPDYHRGIGNLYGSNFTLAELAEIHRFFSTPTGRKLSQGMQINMTFDNVMGQAVSNPDAPATNDAVESDYKETIARTPKSIDPWDQAELERFGKAPWFPKLSAFRSKLIAFETEFMNRPSPKFEAEIQQSMERTMQRFIAAERESSA